MAELVERWLLMLVQAVISGCETESLIGLRAQWGVCLSFFPLPLSPLKLREHAHTFSLSQINKNIYRTEPDLVLQHIPPERGEALLPLVPDQTPQWEKVIPAPDPLATWEVP